jgi:hypothetical protein
MRSELRASGHPRAASFGRRAYLRGVLALLTTLGLGCDVYDPAFLGRLDAGPRIDGGDRDGGGRDGGDGDAGDAGDNDGGEPDGGTDAEVDAGPTACGKQPVARGGGSGGGDEITFIMRDPIMEQTAEPNPDRWVELGYDLDGFCTDSATAPAQCRPPRASAPLLDGAEGVDNVVGGSLFPVILTYEATFESDTAAQMLRGNTFAVRIRNWNHEDNDASVEATFAQTVTLSRPDEGTEPGWDGDDTWTLSSLNFDGGRADMPKIFSDAAYITDRVLVFRLPDREVIALPNGDFRTFNLRLTDARIIGRISDDETRLENAVLVGRFAKTDLMTGIAGGFGYCPASPQYLALDTLVDTALDVRSAQDDVGDDLECNAMSMAIGFTGYAGRWGIVEDPITTENPCP